MDKILSWCLLHRGKEEEETVVLHFDSWPREDRCVSLSLKQVSPISLWCFTLIVFLRCINKRHLRNTTRNHCLGDGSGRGQTSNCAPLWLLWHKGEVSSQRASQETIFLTTNMIHHIININFWLRFFIFWKKRKMRKNASTRRLRPMTHSSHMRIITTEDFQSHSTYPL